MVVVTVRPLALDHVSFEVIEGEILSLLGPSGCGKSTTLRLIAGLEEPDAGEIPGVVADVSYIESRYGREKKSPFALRPAQDERLST